MCAVRLLVSVVLLVLASGCSNDAPEPAQRDSTTTSGRSSPLAVPAFPGAGVDCPTDEPRPITVQLATEALAAGGFDVVFDESACGLGVIAGMLSNASTSPDVVEDEGIIVCFLFVRPRGESGLEAVGNPGGAHAERRLANLTCDLYADRAPAAEKFSRLDESFDDLRRKLR
jgi:hypothetical protein